MHIARGRLVNSFPLDTKPRRCWKIASFFRIQEQGVWNRLCLAELNGPLTLVGVFSPAIVVENLFYSG